MKKKILAVLMAATMVSSLAACGSSAPATADTTEQTEAAPAETAEAPAAEATEATEAPAEATDMKVAMVTDYGDITDQSFNQSTYEACKAFGEANGVEFTYYKPEGDSDAERVAMIDKAVADGFNVIVMPGYAFAGAIKETAEMYPDIKYVALDVSEYDLEGDSSDFNNKTYDNVFSAVYQEELPGYMAGYAAVKMGYTLLHQSLALTSRSTMLMVTSSTVIQISQLLWTHGTRAAQKLYLLAAAVSSHLQARQLLRLAARLSV